MISGTSASAGSLKNNIGVKRQKQEEIDKQQTKKVADMKEEKQKKDTERSRALDALMANTLCYLCGEAKRESFNEKEAENIAMAGFLHSNEGGEST